MLYTCIMYARTNGHDKTGECTVFSVLRIHDNFCVDPDPDSDPDPSIFIIDLQDTNKKTYLKGLSYEIDFKNVDEN